MLGILSFLLFTQLDPDDVFYYFLVRSTIWFGTGSRYILRTFLYTFSTQASRIGFGKLGDTNAIGAGQSRDSAGSWNCYSKDSYLKYRHLYRSLHALRTIPLDLLTSSLKLIIPQSLYASKQLIVHLTKGGEWRHLPALKGPCRLYTRREYSIHFRILVETLSAVSPSLLRLGHYLQAGWSILEGPPSTNKWNPLSIITIFKWILTKNHQKKFLL